MSDSVHLLILFAASQAPGSREKLATLKLPHLEALLSSLSSAHEWTGTGEELSMPYEKALAGEWKIGEADGLLPFAALEQSDPASAWARITPCHWNVGMGQVSMGIPDDLQLTGAHSQALLAAMQPYFEQDGLQLRYESATKWFASGELFRSQPAASLDRVSGRQIDPWLPRGDAGRPLRRLQQEMQMLLYTHPVNDERAAAGLLPVNSFWVSDTGALPTSAAVTPVRIAGELREPALHGDWSSWGDSWERIDAQHCAHLHDLQRKGKAVRLTLSAEKGYRTWGPEGLSLWGRMNRAVRRVRAADMLGAL